MANLFIGSMVMWQPLGPMAHESHLLPFIKGHFHGIGLLRLLSLTQGGALEAMRFLGTDIVGIFGELSLLVLGH